MTGWLGEILPYAILAFLSAVLLLMAKQRFEPTALPYANIIDCTACVESLTIRATRNKLLWRNFGRYEAPTDLLNTEQKAVIVDRVRFLGENSFAEWLNAFFDNWLDAERILPTMYERRYVSFVGEDATDRRSEDSFFMSAMAIPQLLLTTGGLWPV